MNANPDLQRRRQVGGEQFIQILELGRHPPDSADGLDAGGTRLGVDAEQGHDAVADELVDAAATSFDRLSHGPEVAVEDIDHVIGQLGLGDRREVADIGEQNSDLLFLPLMRRRLCVARHSAAAMASPTGCATV